jgi:anti-sigma regulatory factor (Ser/Thr protein kinase)
LDVDDPAGPANVSPLGARLEVPDRLDSIPAARAFLTQLLDGWGVTAEVIDDASLMTSELMSNAVRHGVGVVNLRIEVKDGLLHVSVHDESREAPVMNAANDSDSGGRGMWIVQSLARDWGSDSDSEDPGKTVWFELVALQTPTGPPSA